MRLETVMNEQDISDCVSKKIKGNKENIKVIVTGRLIGLKNVMLLLIQY